MREPAFVDQLAGDLGPISLEQLDERAALRERVDTKYVVERDPLAATVDSLAEQFMVLEIDGRRSFDYESVYFDTPDLHCFCDHVEEARPRFKARSRCYRETEACFLEIKVKDADDATTKRQCEYDPSDHGRLTDAGVEFLADSLRELAGLTLPADLAPALSTRYRRITLAAAEGAERVTLDFDVCLRAMDNREVGLRDPLVLVETKTEDGKSTFDSALVDAGREPVGISKYRIGVGLLLADDPEEAGPLAVRGSFT